VESLISRGIGVTRDVGRADAVAVLERYGAQGGRLY
jgi:hypothetical protein